MDAGVIAADLTAHLAAEEAAAQQEASRLPVELPPLREDLQLVPAAANRDGSPAWMIHDPVTNRFFQIGWLEFTLLSRWHAGTPQALLDAVARETPLAPTEDELIALLAFLSRQQLLRSSHARASDYLMALRQARKATGLKWLLHNYLFIRVPLWRPQRFLQATMPWVAPLFSRGFVMLVALLTVTGLLLASRQWDVFLTTFQDKLTLEGLAGYMLALAFTKSLHELGHAYTATRYGVRVAHMGFALLVMWPVLYTDTSESWKLSDRRQRFHIAGAGILVELMIAGLATLAWSLTEEPVAKSAFFFLATASWLISLTLNASPFMRFDGYFLLSDALDIPNLHERAAALARAQLRRTLLGWDEPDAEYFAPRLRRGLVIFSWITWAYRFFVFLGIAAAVYFFFFKLLGIVLFAVEVMWFVAMPIMREVRVWAARGGIRPLRPVIALLLLLAVGAPLVLAGHDHVRAPAWLHSATQHTFYSPLPARIVESLAQEGPVKAGQPLYVLDVPEIRNKAERADEAVQALRQQLAGLQGMQDGEEKRAVLLRQLAQQESEAASQRAEMQRLTLRAPMDGWLYDIDPELTAGTWVTSRQALGMAVDGRHWIVDAFIQQQDLEAIKPGSAARFYPRNDLSTVLTGTVASVDTARTQHLPHAMLDTEHGGQVPAVTSRNGQMAPRDVLYRVQIVLNEPPPAHAVRAGNVVIEAQDRGWTPQWVKDIFVVLIRESGF
jgi:putative peptide zinc metalloprotease protein